MTVDAGDSQRTEVRRALDPSADRVAITYAAELLRAGRLVAFPTETVYGLGADATNAEAVAAIFRAKGRPTSDPLIVHLAHLDDLPAVAAAIPAVVEPLAARFWPGPLTLVLPRSARIPALVTAGGDTVGVRLPAHPIARALIEAAGVPVAAPSANRFMHISPTTAAHVLADLDGRIACVLDGGACQVGVESTVVDLSRTPPLVLRPGGVPVEALRALLPDLAMAPSRAVTAASCSAEPQRAPGHMERHYAPQARLVVFDGTRDAMLRALVAEVRARLEGGQRVGVLVTDDEMAALAGLEVRLVSLGPPDDLAVVAQRLYAGLRELDTAHVASIVTHAFGEAGLGLALRDRLRRAAGGSLTPAPGV